MISDGWMQSAWKRHVDLAITNGFRDQMEGVLLLRFKFKALGAVYNTEFYLSLPGTAHYKGSIK